MNLTELSGQFDIVAPELSDNWECYGDSFTFKMSPSPGTGKHLWVSFELGVVSGVMRSTGPPPKTTNTPIEFTWRGAETGEGETTFGEDNVASVVFLGDGKIKGKISGDLFQEVDFVGKKSSTGSRNVVWTKSVRAWKERYRGINERSYDRASTMRWGGWMDDDGCEGSPEESDTTDGGPGEDSNSEDEFDADDLNSAF